MLNRIELMRHLKGKIFGAVFVKKNGETRIINARLGVKKHLKGGVKSYNDADLNHITVYDLNAKDYRTIDLDSILSIKSGSFTFTK